MKGFLVNVATGAMASLVEKLGTMLTVDEYKLLTDVHGDIKFLKDELETMQAFLLTMADEEDPDHLAKLRANALRELSYDIEDKIDKYMLLVDQESSSNNNGIREILNKSMEKIANLKSHHRIAEEIKDIKSQVKDMTDRYARYKIDGSSRSRCEKVDPRLMSLYKDASELVGIDVPGDELVEWISSETGTSESANQIKVISILGCGGLGKTTLARQVFQNIGSSFDCRAFVSISRKPVITKILSSILSRLRNDYDAHTGEVELDLTINQIRNFLEEKRWIAEGLIHGEDGQDLVELGEKYVKQLVDRSLIQVADTGYYISNVLCCQVHDTILDFLIHKSSEENFCTLLSKHSKPDRKIRRLTIMGNEDHGSVERLDLSHARAIAAFGNAGQLPSVVQSSTLRVLDLSYCSGVENDHIKDIGRLLLLRYLSISSENVSELPGQIGNLLYLETLDASRMKLVELPESVTHLKNLAHLFVPDGTKCPDGIEKMEKLQEIGSLINIFKQSLKFLEELGNLFNLRKLRITWDTDELNRARLKGPMLVASLSKLDTRKLHSLSINFNLTENDATLLAGPPFFLPPLKSIRDVTLNRGKLRWINEWLLLLVNLEIFRLRDAGQEITQQDVEMIGSIPTLQQLRLWGHWIVPTVNTSNSWGYQKLKLLELYSGENSGELELYPGVAKLMFEAGAMQNLRVLILWVVLLDKEYGDFDYSGFLQLPRLANVCVRIYYIGAGAAYVEAVKVAFDDLVNEHPNRPALHMMEFHGLRDGES